MEESDVVAEYHDRWRDGNYRGPYIAKRTYGGLRGLRAKHEEKNVADYVYAFANDRWLVTHRAFGCWIEVDYLLKQRSLGQ